MTEDHKLQQCAEILLCFCLDFSSHRTTQITHHRYKLVSYYYDHFRKLITEKNLSQDKLGILSSHRGDIRMLHDESRCRWCKTKLRPGEQDGKPPVFGVQFRESGEVHIEPLKDDEAVLHFHVFGSRGEAPGRREVYAGFICCGKFHRFREDERSKEGAEQLWTWIREKVRSHHGIWKRNTGYYLKELEWKYNNRSLDPDEQAKQIIALIPMNFLSSWSLSAKGGFTPVQTKE